MIRVSALCLQVLLLAACASPTVPPPADPAASQQSAPALWTHTFPPLQYPGASLRFAHYGLEEGLSQSSAQAFLQDRQGFLWIGTQDGLNRFNGYSFTVFRPDPHDANSLSSGEILSLSQARDGKIWIGTSAGLNRYDPLSGKFQHWTHSPGDLTSLADNTVNVVYEDGRGTLWVGTGRGLDRFIATSGRFVHESLSGAPPSPAGADVIRALYESDPRTLWVGTDKGLVHYSIPDGKARRYLNDNGSGTTISSDEISSISQGPDGELWIGTHLGLNRMDVSTGQFTRFTHSDTELGSLADNWVETIMVDRAGQLWVGTRGGLDRFDPRTQQFIHYRSDAADPASLSSNLIDALYEDRGGVLWVGTADGGLNQHDRSQDQFAYYHHSSADPHSLSSDVVFPIVPDASGRLWIGTYDAGLNLFDPSTGQAEHFRHDPAVPASLLNDAVLSLFIDRDGALWIGTHLGLDRLLRSSNTFMHYVNDPADPNSLPRGAVYSIYQDRSLTYWIGTAHGLRILDPSTGEVTLIKPSTGDASGLMSSPVRAIFQEGEGDLWFGTEARGLYRFDPATGVLRHYMNDPRGQRTLSNNSVLTIQEDHSGTIWIGTFGGGLDRYLPDQDGFAAYRQEQGLPNDVVYGILEDKQGDLWLSTNLGLSRFHVATAAFDNFTVSNGLQSNEFDSGSFAIDAAGRMYFGGVRGLTVFDPAAIQKNPYVPPLVLTSLSTPDGKPAAAGPVVQGLDQITLRYPQNSFDVGFAALSFSRPQSNQYKYMLEGFESTWHSAGADHRGSYTNLPGGTYTLRVLGSNSDGVWNEAGASIRIVVVPPFWQTWLFRLLAGLGLVLVAFVAYRSRVHSIESQKSALERVVRDRTEALQKRNTDLEALYSADEKMLRALTQDEVLQALVDMAVDTLEADRSAVFTPLPGQPGFCVRVARGFRPETINSPEFTLDQQDALSHSTSGRVLILSDSVEDPQWRSPGSPLAVLMETHGFRSIMYMPITVQDDVRGILGVYCSTSSQTFNERRQRLFASLVQRAALSIENSRLFEETKQLAILEERSRLAQDLHDSTKQKAFAALAQLGAVKKQVNQEHGGAARNLEEAENLVSDVIRDLTFFIQEFYPASLKEKGLAAALRNYAYAWERRSGIQLDVQITDERRLPPQAEQALYRILQEGLSNIARHSHATRASVRLAFTPRDVEVRVEDDGVGFDLPTTVRGLGLQLIQERAESIGGEAVIQTSPGHGTLLTVRVPAGG